MSPRIRTNAHYQVAAFHEAGHAVVGLWLGWQIKKVVVKPRQPGNGFVRFFPTKETRIAVKGPASAELFWSRTLASFNAQAKIFLAGPIAEARLLGTPLRSLGARSDLESVLELIESLDNIRRQLAPFYDVPPHCTKGLSDRLTRQTRRLIVKPKIWGAITVLANDLINWDTLTGEDVAETVMWAFGPKNQPSLF